MIEFDFKVCPVCSGELYINRLACKNCKAEFPVDRPMSKYDILSDGQKNFLTIFLRHRGNIKSVGAELHISYPTVKRRLDDLLITLGLENQQQNVSEVVLDMNKFSEINCNSNTPSEIVRSKLYANGGSAVISLLDGKPCTIKTSMDGKFFTSDKLNKHKLAFEYSVFDCIVDLLMHSAKYQAPKGSGHGKDDKVGYGKCTEDTIIGTIAINYFQKQYGESTYDPTFVLAAILDWAGIGINARGFVSLDPSYVAKIKK